MYSSVKRDRLQLLSGWSVPELALDGVWEKQSFPYHPYKIV